MKIKLATMALLGLLSVQAFGAECTLIQNGPVTSAYSVDSDGLLNCDYVTHVEETITTALKFSEDKVKVSLFVQHQNDNAGFDGGNIIHVPEQLVFRNDYDQEYPVLLMANLATVAHEYGHALLEKKLERELLAKFPKYANYILANQELSALKIAAAKSPDSVELKKKIEDKNKAIYANKDFIRFANVTLPYSELYADVVAGFTFNSKTAISNALYYDAMNDFQYRMIQTRSFDAEFTDRHKIYMSEAHCMFAYTRNFIGKNMWPTNESSKKILLKKIGDAIVAEISTFLAKDSDLPGYQEVNDALIARLQKSLK